MYRMYSLIFVILQAANISSFMASRDITNKTTEG